MRSLPAPAAIPLLLALGAPLAGLGAQHQHATEPEPLAVHAELGAGAIGLVTRAAPAFDGRTFTEGYLTQPVLMGHVAVPALAGLRLAAMLNFEGLTLDRGELNAGIYGEGYVDRRHPHTLVHELVASVGGAIGGRGAARWSLAAGKGFAPFGSDDPMSRPFVKFPVNHHLAQILERWVAVGGVRAGPVMLEVAAFNGDEPVDAYSWPMASRFGDSFTARATVTPVPWLELSASGAAVASPESPDGLGLDQRKLHLGARAERGRAGTSSWRYGLAEYGRTDDRSLGQLAHYYETLLVEAGIGFGAWELAARGERSDRPEEERLADPFRTLRSHSHGTVLGITRWTVGTLAVARALPEIGGLALRPFAEVALARPEARTPQSAFQPEAFYGGSRLWSLSGGLRVQWGMRHERMGRYGVAAELPDPAGTAHGASHGTMHDQHR